MRSTDGKSYQIETPTIAWLSFSSDQAKSAYDFANAEIDGHQLTISPAGTVNGVYTIRGLSQVGRYDGALRLRHETEKKNAKGETETETDFADVPVSIIVRRPWWVAMVLIAAGVMTSTAIQTWLATGRRRLAARRDLSWVEETLASYGRRADAREARVLGSLRSQIKFIERDIALNLDVADDVELLTARAKLLPHLFAATKLASRLRKADGYAEAQSSLEDLAELIDQTAAADLASIRGGAEKIKKTIGQALEAELRSAINELEEQIGRNTKDIPKEKLKPLQASIEQARNALKNNAVEKAADRLDSVRESVASVLIKLLESTVNVPAPFPAQKAAWERLQDRIAAEAGNNARDTASAYEAAFSTYLKGLLDICKDELERVGRQEATRSEPAGRALAAITAAEQALAAGDLLRAEEELVNARERLLEAGGKTRRGALVLESAGDTDGSAPVLGAVGIPGIGSTLTAAFSLVRQALPAEPRTGDDFQSRIQKVDLGVTSVLLAVAVLSGLRFLWGETEAWGNGGNMIVALLWGFGIHQFGTGPLEGLFSASRKGLPSARQ
ncbi:MAG: hypothetical protein JNK04_25505 [Myxococcales bacterium]|nr:hypothetical protein [Myxococcales bacterium]